MKTRVPVHIAVSGTHIVDFSQTPLVSLTVDPGVSVDIIDMTAAVATPVDVIIDIGSRSHVSYVIPEEKNTIRRHAVVHADASIVWYHGVTASCIASIHSDLVGQYATAHVRCVHIGTHEHNLTIRHTVSHASSATRSSIITRGLVGDRSKSNVMSDIRIAKGYMGCVASQRANNLVLSQKAVIYQVPELHIDEHNVICSHAVATTFVGDELLFYPESRGFTRTDAVRMIAEGHVATILDEMPETLCRAIKKHI